MSTARRCTCALYKLAIVTSLSANIFQECSSGTPAFSTLSVEKIDSSKTSQSGSHGCQLTHGLSGLIFWSQDSDIRKVPEPTDEWPLESICRLVAQQRSVSVSKPLQNHRKTIQWTNHVPKDSIILFDFALPLTTFERQQYNT